LVGWLRWCVVCIVCTVWWMVWWCEVFEDCVCTSDLFVDVQKNSTIHETHLDVGY
jgi:hypothetical protein